MEEMLPFERIPRAGSPSVLELSSHDPVSTQHFLEAVFGWNFPAPDPAGHDGVAFEMPDGGKGRVHPLSNEAPPAGIEKVRVFDLGATLERAQRAGGSLVMPRVEAPGMGSFFVVRIPGGPILTCWEAEAPPRPR